MILKFHFECLPLSSGNGLSFLSNRKAHRSTLGISTLGYVDSVGIIEDSRRKGELKK